MKSQTGFSIEKIMCVSLSFLFLLFNYFVSDCYQQIISAWMFWIIITAIMKFDIMHPFVWYIGIHTLYYTAYPIMYFQGARTEYGYSSECLLLSSLALFVFIIIVPASHNNGEVVVKPKENDNLNRIILYIMSITVLLSSIYIKFHGYSGKNEIYTSSIFLTLIFSMVLVFINMSAIELGYAVEIIDKLRMKILLLEVCIPVFMITLFSGERDLLFRLIVIIVFILYFYKKINRLHILLFGIFTFFLLIPLSVSFKYYFLTGEKNIHNYELNISKSLSGEFESASRNLQILLNNESNTKGLMNGLTLVNDVTTVFGYAPFSAIRWFQNSFFYGRETGMGFSLIGEGYINFGYYGVIIVYAIVGIFIRILYNNYRKNIFCLSAYICSVPLFMYANRADLSNIFSQFVKHVLLSILLYYFLYNIIIARSNRNRIYSNESI